MAKSSATTWSRICKPATSGRFKAKQLLPSLTQIRHGSHRCCRTRQSDYFYPKRLDQATSHERELLNRTWLHGEFRSATNG